MIPIVVTLVGIVIDVSDLHPWKADEPDVTVRVSITLRSSSSSFNVVVMKMII